MATVKDIIGSPGEVDYFRVDLITQVDYVFAAFGTANRGGTLRDPALVLYDQNSNLWAFNDNSFALGSDPFIQFKAPFTGTYYIGVTDLTGGVGSYTLTFDRAGVPIFF